MTDANKGHFAGPHYDDEEKTVFVLYEWTPWLKEKNTFNRVYDLCEQKGIDFRFNDEIIIDEHGRAHERQPSMYGDSLSWAYSSCGEFLWTRDEVSDYLEDYAESLENCPTVADKWNTDFSSLGYEKHSGQFESGFHPGQTDNPETIQAELLKTYDSVIWSIDSSGQFDCGFSAWVKKD